MQNLSINSNQGSQAYGSDPGGAVILGSVVKATVVEKLDENLYLLQVGKQTFEAQVLAELDEGTEYKFVVEKGGQPPELSLLQDGASSKQSNGLSAEENLWVDRLAKLMGLPTNEVDAKSLLQWMRSLGFDINQSVEQVFQQLKPVLELLPAIDSAPPVIRQLMGHTLLFTMHQQNHQNMGDTWFEQAIRLSGQIPKWNEQESKWLLELKQIVESLPKEQQNQIKSELLGLSKGAKTFPLLQKLLENNPLQSLSGSEQKPSTSLQQVVQSIVDDPTKRLFLVSQQDQSSNSRTIGSLQRHEAISAFQRQAPSLMGSDISNLLEQFTSLGGKLEKLSIGDVVSAQLAWKGNTPSAMEVHRSGALLHLTQDLPKESRQLSHSDLISQAPKHQMPVVLDKGMVSDPSTSSISLHKLQEFSQQSQLPNTYHVDRLLQNWHHSGGALSELRGNLDAINQWNTFIESFPELRSVLAEHLIKSPSITSAHRQMELSPLPIQQETQQQLQTSLQESGMVGGSVSKKEMSKVMQAVQQVAGEGQTPSKSLIAVATWLVGKGIEVTPNSLQALLTFQQGHSSSAGLYQNIKDLQQWIQNQQPNMSQELQKALVQLQATQTQADGSSTKPDSGSLLGQLKENISFYQKGNGQQLRQWIAKFQEGLSQQNLLRSDVAQLLQQLQGRLSSHEEFLSGLKHYNIQAQRQDTPQVYELPVAFGETVDHALLRIFKRQQGKDPNDGQKNYKVVIDLNLEGLGKVRSEVTLINQHLQLDFLSPDHGSLNILKNRSEELKQRLEDNDLKAAMGFKLKAIENDAFIAEHKTVEAPKEKSNIDIIA